MIDQIKLYPIIPNSFTESSSLLIEDINFVGTSAMLANEVHESTASTLQKVLLLWLCVSASKYRCKVWYIAEGIIVTPFLPFRRLCKELLGWLDAGSVKQSVLNVKVPKQNNNQCGDIGEVFHIYSYLYIRDHSLCIYITHD